MIADKKICEVGEAKKLNLSGIERKRGIFLKGRKPRKETAKKTKKGLGIISALNRHSICKSKGQRKTENGGLKNFPGSTNHRTGGASTKPRIWKDRPANRARKNMADNGREQTKRIESV